MKVFCRWCKGVKRGHVVSKKITVSHGIVNGGQSVTTIRVKIHKHHKGKMRCRGSDKIIEK